MKKNKTIYILIGIVVILIIVAVGITYAWLTTTLRGEKEYVLKAGTLNLILDENSSEVINIAEAYPMSDEEGKAQEIVYRFTVENTGTVAAGYEIYLDDAEIEASDIRVDDSNIKYDLRMNEGPREGGLLSETDNRKIEDSILNVGQSRSYELRLWLKEDSTANYNEVFSGKLRIEAIQKKYAVLKRRSTYDSTDDYYAYKDSITAIETKEDILIPDSAIESWDVSEAGDGSVVAYLEDDGSGNSTYKLTIGGDGSLIAPTNCNHLFRNFSKLTSIDLSNLDTSPVTNMGAMFSGNTSLTKLDISNFDTSKVIDMGSMFYGCSSLINLEVSNFNTSNVTTMQTMFQGCSRLDSLNLSSFNTSNVTNMFWMFSGCGSLTYLNVTSFDTSKVTNMGWMFYQCSQLEKLDVSSFDTLQVQTMQSMFQGCSHLDSLDLSNFDTSNVTNMAGIFLGCTSLNYLNVSSFNTSKVTTMQSMFQGLSALKEIDLSDFDTSNVTNMATMFYECNQLKILDLTSFDVSKVTNMSGMFQQCSGLTEILVSNKWVINSSTNITDMFTDASISSVTVV